MATKELTTTIPPEAEAEFLEALLPSVGKLARDATGAKLQAAAHYQQELSDRLQAIRPLCAAPKRRRSQQ